MKVSVLQADDDFRANPPPHFSPILDFRKREIQGHSPTFEILFHHYVKHLAGGGVEEQSGTIFTPYSFLSGTILKARTDVIPKYILHFRTNGYYGTYAESRNGLFIIPLCFYSKPYVCLVKELQESRQISYFAHLQGFCLIYCRSGVRIQVRRRDVFFSNNV